MSTDSGVVAGLPATGTVDLATLGRRSGEQRWVEIWYVVVEGRLLVTGTPGRRDWLANLRADPRAAVRFRAPTREVQFEARVISDEGARLHLVPRIWRVQPWYAAQPYSLDEWVDSAPVVELATPASVAGPAS